jgi:aminoglycoside phosphotransferase family enzyme
MCRLGGSLAFGGDGSVVDWAVHMRRVPDAARADELLGRGALTPAAVDAIAEHIVGFHKTARVGPEVDVYGEPEAIARNVVENFA